jgi:hypothetical protein
LSPICCHRAPFLRQRQLTRPLRQPPSTNQLLDGSPAGTLSDFAARLRARAVWLESLEAKVAAGARGLALAPPLPAAVPQAPRGLAPDADVAPEFPPAPLAPPGDGAGAAFCSVASQLGLSALAPGDDGGAADFFGASPPRGASPLENRPLGPFGGELAASPRGARPGRARRAARR